MFTYQSLSKRPLVFKRLTGLTIEEFNLLLDKFKSGWLIFIRDQFLSKERKRKFGGGRKSRLDSLEDKLLFILIYVRLYPLMVVQGIFFDFEDSRACQWVHRLLPILDQVTGFAHTRPRRGNGRSLDEILREFPELKEFGISLDGTERPTKRSKNPEKQKSQYSGKKKRHTVKNIVAVSTKNSQIFFLSKTRDGTVHDKRILDEEYLSCHDPHLEAATDSAFIGAKIGSLKLVMPKKNTKLHKLTSSDKEQNRAISSIRVKAEHAIAGIKRSRSVKDIHRNFKEGFDDLLMSVACGLHNFRVIHRQAS